MKYNLHTHSFYCRHGEGTIQEYVDEAERIGLQILGFSEHCPYPDRILESNFSRMYYPMMPFYERDVRLAAEKSSIKILLGYECDIWPGRDSYISSLKERTDYLICGVHFLPSYDGSIMSSFTDAMVDSRNLKIYTDAYIHAISSGMFLFCAHPDVYMYCREKWDNEAKVAAKAIISAAVECNIPLEINANGILKALREGKSEYGYPHREFWSLASEMGASCVLSSDAHKIENLSANESRLKAFANSFDLKFMEPVIENGTVKLVSKFIESTEIRG